jgi:hypothetical protein
MTPLFFKKIFVLGIVSLLIGSDIFAATIYPAKLNDGKPFEQLSDFQDIYQKIHNDIQTIDETEVIRRACQHEAINCTHISDEKKSSYKNFIQHFQKTTTSRSRYDQIMNTVRSTLQFEQELLTTENSWSRQLQMRTMSMDTNHGGKNSYRDLVAESLHSIEKIFIGPRSKEFKANFAVDNENQAPITEPEDWQNQRDNGSVVIVNFDESEMDSMGGIIDNLQQYLAKITSQSTVANRVPKNIFEPWAATSAIGISQCPGLNTTVAKPLKSTDIPLVLQTEISTNLLDQNQNFLQSISQQGHCYLTASNNDKNQNQQQKLNQCENIRLSKITNQKNNFQKEQIRESLQREYQAVKYGLDYFESVVGFLKEATIQQIALFECYLDHTSN